jgi:hypothetical protein
MKKKYLLSGLFIAVTIIMVNTTNVTSNISSPPPASVGDAFVGNTCARAGCHETNPAQSIPNGALTFNIGTGQPTTPLTANFEYSPDTTYNIAFTPTSQASVYGFSMSALNSSAQQAGTFTLTNTNTTSISTISGGRTYVGHKNANGSKNWGFKWTAPSAGTGCVTFSYAFNLGSGDGTRFNDSIFVGDVTICPLSSGINDISNKISSLQIFPNPANQEFRISFSMKESNTVSAQLYSLEGRNIKNLLSETLQQVNFNRAFDITDLSSGIYLVKLKVGDSFTTQKIVKQ